MGGTGIGGAKLSRRPARGGAYAHYRGTWARAAVQNIIAEGEALGADARP
ncbi:MAG: hypothetical protein ACLR7U_11175 [Ruthenibacterium lactatiformans]